MISEYLIYISIIPLPFKKNPCNPSSRHFLFGDVGMILSRESKAGAVSVPGESCSGRGSVGGPPVSLERAETESEALHFPNLTESQGSCASCSVVIGYDLDMIWYRQYGLILSLKQPLLGEFTNWWQPNQHAARWPALQSPAFKLKCLTNPWIWEHMNANQQNQLHCRGKSKVLGCAW